MKQSLKPKGTAPVVYLDLLNDHYFHADFIVECIRELEAIPLKIAVGVPPSNLEKLAFLILKNSIGLV